MPVKNEEGEVVDIDQHLFKDSKLHKAFMEGSVMPSPTFSMHVYG